VAQSLHTLVVVVQEKEVALLLVSVVSVAVVLAI
jgi:hypothetical protein